jgi:hypothetical protein
MSKVTAYSAGAAAATGNTTSPRLLRLQNQAHAGSQGLIVKLGACCDLSAKDSPQRNSSTTYVDLHLPQNTLTCKHCCPQRG